MRINQYVYLVIEHAHKAYIEHPEYPHYVDVAAEVHGIYLDRRNAEAKALALVTPTNHGHVAVLKKRVQGGTI